jgi:hypothetical protein
MATSGSQFTDITCVNTSGGLTSSQYLFVRSTGVASDGSLDAQLCVSATGGVTRAKGVLQNDPDSGQAATVRIEGLTKLYAGGSISVGGFVASSTAGTGVSGATTGAWVAAIAETASTAAGQIISVRLLNAGFYYSAGGTA